MKIIFVIIELQEGSYESDDLLFSEVMRLGKTKNLRRTTSEHRPKIFIQPRGSSCHEDILEELKPLLYRHTVILISVDSACETMKNIIEYFKKQNHDIDNAYCYMINPHILLSKANGIFIKHVFSDCSKSSRMKDHVMMKKTNKTADIEWISISYSPLEVSYSITLLKHIFYKFYDHHIR